MKLVRLSKYLKRVMDTISVKLDAKSCKARPLSSMYSRIDELPLRNFIKIVVTGDKTWLLKDRTQELPKEAQEVWNELFIEYLEAMGDEKYKLMMKTSFDLQTQHTRLIILAKALNELIHRKSEKLVEVFKKAGYPVGMLADDATYYKGLELIKKKLQALGLELKRKQAQLDQLKQHHEGAAVTEEAFTSLIINISKWLQYRIDTEKVSVSEFVAMIKQYKKEAELRQWQTQKR